jgi:hypothetical protein
LSYGLGAVFLHDVRNGNDAERPSVKREQKRRFTL